MKKAPTNKQDSDTLDNMLPEYDFRGGIRGKHHEAYRAGHAVTVHKGDETSQVQHFTREEGAVLLEPDVREYFPDSETVNKALRSLIALIPSKRRLAVRDK